jgi:hypothetical protein
MADIARTLKAKGQSMATDNPTGVLPESAPADTPATNPFQLIAEDVEQFDEAGNYVEEQTDEEPQWAEPIQTPEEQPSTEATAPNPYSMSDDEYRAWIVATPPEEQRRVLAELNPDPAQTVWMQRGLTKKTQEFAEAKRQYEKQIETLNGYLQQLTANTQAPPAPTPTPTYEAQVDPYTGLPVAPPPPDPRVEQVLQEVNALKQTLQQQQYQTAMVELHRGMDQLEQRHQFFTSDMRDQLFEHMGKTGNWDLQSAFKSMYFDELLNEGISTALKAQARPAAPVSEVPPTAPQTKGVRGESKVPPSTGNIFRDTFGPQ